MAAFEAAPGYIGLAPSMFVFIVVVTGIAAAIGAVLSR
jgi:hypothetical protein